MGRIEDLREKEQDEGLTESEDAEIRRLRSERREEIAAREPEKIEREAPPKSKSFGERVKAVFVKADDKLKTKNRERRTSKSEKDLQQKELKKIFAKAEFKAAKKRAKKEGKKSGSGKKPKGFFGQLSKGLSGFTAASVSEAGQISTNVDLIGGGGSGRSSTNNMDILGFASAPRRTNGKRRKQRKFDLNDIL